MMMLSLGIPHLILIRIDENISVRFNKLVTNPSVIHEAEKLSVKDAKNLAGWGSESLKQMVRFCLKFFFLIFA
jgi:hypothetical protein